MFKFKLNKIAVNHRSFYSRNIYKNSRGFCLHKLNILKDSKKKLRGRSLWPNTMLILRNLLTQAESCGIILLKLRKGGNNPWRPKSRRPIAGFTTRYCSKSSTPTTWAARRWKNWRVRAARRPRRPRGRKRPTTWKTASYTWNKIKATAYAVALFAHRDFSLHKNNLYC